MIMNQAYIDVHAGDKEIFFRFVRVSSRSNWAKMVSDTKPTHLKSTFFHLQHLSGKDNVANLLLPRLNRSLHSSFTSSLMSKRLYALHSCSRYNSTEANEYGPKLSHSGTKWSLVCSCIYMNDTLEFLGMSWFRFQHK